MDLASAVSYFCLYLLIEKTFFTLLDCILNFDPLERWVEHFFRCKDNAFYLIFSVFKISFRQLEHFQSVSWRFFTLPVGGFLFRQLENCSIEIESLQDIHVIINARSKEIILNLFY